ncbi:MAG: condensation domain-containing protein [Cyanobacteria bacterium P01_F01_bin.86]
MTLDNKTLSPQQPIATESSSSQNIHPSDSSTAQQDTAERPIKTAQQSMWEAIRNVIALQNKVPAPSPLPGQANYPVSFSQERLWLLDKATPGTTAYNLPFAFHLQGVLNIAALDQSLREILNRHTTLRISIAMVDGQPRQAIAPLSAMNLEMVDLRERPEAERLIEAKQQVEAEARKPFDLSQASLMRAKLWQLGETEHLLVLTIHHIVFDGWSEGLLWQELSTLYAAFCVGQPSPLEDLPIQYHDYAHWQRQWMQGELLEQLVSYWQDQLKDCAGELPLPLDHPRPVQQRRPAKHLSFQLSPDLTAQLKTLSRKEGATLFAVLLSAFKVLLYHYSEQNEVLVCTPVANRNRKELRQVMGYFVNLLLLRTDLSGDLSFRTLVERVRQGVTGAYAYQDLPVQQVVSNLGGVQIPLSQVMFVLQNMPSHTLELTGVEVSRWEVDSDTADFDLALTLVEREGSLTGKCSYSAELFEAETIKALLQHFETVLQQCVTEPEKAIAQLLPLSDSEQQQWREKRLACQTPQQIERQEYVAPRNDIERRLVALWQQVLGGQQISVSDNFFDLGGYSLLAAKLLNDIEGAFGKSLTLTDIFQAPTVEQLAQILTQENRSPSLSALIPIQPNGSKPPLFAIHYLGTNMRWYRPLAQHLGVDQPIYGLIDRVAIQNVLSTKQETATLKVEELAAYYIKEMRTFQPEGPYRMSGISFGGTIAFEMARQLQQQGQKVSLIALFDTLGPDDSPQKPQSRQGVANHLKTLKQQSSKGRFSYLRMQIVGKQKWLKNRILKTIKKQNRVITEHAQAFMCKVYVRLGRPLPQDLLDACIKTANDRARKAYTPKFYPGRVTLFRAVDSYLARGNPDMGWGELAGEGLDLHYVPGGHTSMYEEPHVAVLAEKLKASLEQK